MKKIFIVFFAFLLLAFVCGCRFSTTKSEMNSITLKITEEEAVEIAQQYWGTNNGDKDEVTGFSFLIMPVESSNDTITIALKWLVDNHHYSTVDSINIDPYTGKIVGRD